MRAALHAACKSVSLAIGLLCMVSCSPKVYRIPDNGVSTQKEVSVLELPILTNIKVFSVDGVNGPNEAGPLFPDEREYGSSSSGHIRIELSPGKHVLRIGYYQVIPGMFEGRKYSTKPITLVFEGRKGCTYTILANDSDLEVTAKVVETKCASGMKSGIEQSLSCK
jgi:hypothetical protein